MLREWKTEWMKLRRRKAGLLILAFLGFTFVWCAWVVSDADLQDLADGYRWILSNLSIINTILLPTMLAMLASRLCDMEIKGNTLKLICTMEEKGRLFDMKVLTGGVYLVFYVGAELLLLVLGGTLMGFGDPIESKHILYFLLQNIPVSLVIYLLQIMLSFRFENQIIPLAAGLFGSFIGLFSWFFPDSSLFRWIFVWGHYSLLHFIGNTWDEATRIVTYYDVEPNWAALGLVTALLVSGYLACRYLFIRKEV
ncbi:MAG: ABC transporter permease [Candidatus Merdisoma sp.]|jgi:hypothetical protein